MAIQRFDEVGRTLAAVEALSGGGWFHVEDPSAEEQAAVAHHLGVADAFLDHALDVDELARVDRVDGVRLVVLRIPIATNSARDAPFRSIALGVVFTPGCVITICRRHASVARALARREGLDVGRHERFILQLLLSLADQYLRCLDEIDRSVEVLESELQESLRNREVYQLLRYQKALVHFKTALDANRILVDRLQHDASFGFERDEAELFADVLVELAQAIEMASVSSSILGDMMDAFASIISNNLNVVMKALTSLTILVALPNVVASFYGMNVTLPGQGRPDAFAVIVTMSLVLAGGVAAIFVRKRWL
jgi:magnesium transporter